MDANEIRAELKARKALQMPGARTLDELADAVGVNRSTLRCALTRGPLSDAVAAKCAAYLRPRGGSAGARSLPPFDASLVPGSAEYLAEIKARLEWASAEGQHDGEAASRKWEEDRRREDEARFLAEMGWVLPWGWDIW